MVRAELRERPAFSVVRSNAVVASPTRRPEVFANLRFLKQREQRSGVPVWRRQVMRCSAVKESQRDASGTGKTHVLDAILDLHGGVVSQLGVELTRLVSFFLRSTKNAI